MAAPTVKIAGTAYPARRGTLRLTRNIHGRSTGSVEIIDEGASNHFDMNEPVTILDLAGATAFAGWIDAVEERHMTIAGGDTLIHRVDLKDNHYLAEKRVIPGREWAEVASGQIVREIISEFLSVEGVTVGTITDGITVERFPADYISCADAIERLADMNGYIWKINNDRSLDFRARTTVAAGVVAVGSGMLKNTVRVRRRNPEYRNRQYVIGSSNETDADSFGLGPGPNGRLTWQWFLQDDASLVAPSFTFGDEEIHSVRKIAYRTPPSLKFNDLKSFASDLDKLLDNTLDPDWTWEYLGDTITIRSGDTIPAGTEFRMEYVPALAIGRVNHQTLPGNSTRFYELKRPMTSTPRIEVDRGSGFALESVATAGGSVSAAWYFSPWTNQLEHDSGETLLTSSHSIRVTWVEEGPVDAIQESTSEINANRTREGGTTSGIVEQVETAYEFSDAGEIAQKTQEYLHRWAHNTTEVDYQTWDSSLTEGEVQTINLPAHDINNEDYLIEQIRITDQPTNGAADTRQSPLLYTISLIKGQDGASGGAIGRSANPRRFSDLFRRLNDPVRIKNVRDLGTSTVIDFTPGSMKQGAIAGSAFASELTAFKAVLAEGVAASDAFSLGAPADLASTLVWVEADDHAGSPTTLINRISGEPNMGSGTCDVVSGPNSHSALFFEDFDVGSGHSEFTTTAQSSGYYGVPVTVIVVCRIVHWEGSFRGWPVWLQGTGGHEAIIANDTTVGDWIAYNLTNDLGTAATGPGLNSWGLFTGIFVGGGNDRFRIGGSQVASGTMVDASNDTFDTFYAGSWVRNSLDGGEIAAFAVYGADLEATGDLAAQEAYFTDRFGL